MTAKESPLFLQQIQRPPRELPLDWEKGYAAGSRHFYEVAVRPAILDRVAALLGRDVIIWGCKLIAKKAGIKHPWHCDLEASAPTRGKTLNVWVGLRNVRQGSSLSLIPFSHDFEKPIQQIQYEKEIDRGQTNDDRILQWARENRTDA